MSAATGTSHSSPAWLRHGLTSTPGILMLRETRLAFVSDDGAIFDEPLTAVTDIHFPWYRVSGGFRATVAGRRRRISLTRPPGAALPSPHLIEPDSEILTVGIAMASGREGRRRGKAWRALLGAYESM